MAEFELALFVTGSYAASTFGLTTSTEFVRAGREDDVRTTSVERAGAGRLVGWLDVVFTTRSRSWAETLSTEKTPNAATQAESSRTFFKSIKP